MNPSDTSQQSKLKTALAMFWKHSAAAVALLLIGIAFIVGYKWGTPERTSAGPTARTSPTTLYTCSMHPNIAPSADPKAKCPICFMDLIPIPEGMGDLGERQIAFSRAAAKIAEVETATVGRMFPRAEVRLFGRVTYDETSVARLTAYFSGRLDRLFVNYVGVPVARGDHLAEIYSPQLLTAIEELRQALQAHAKSDSGSPILRRSNLETLEAARGKLRLYGLTAQQMKEIESGEFSGDRLTIYSPMSGVVTHLAAREGDYLDTGDPIATVASLKRLWVDLEAYESQLSMLHWGQQVNFTVEAHPGELFQGRIAFIEPEVDHKTRTAAVRVEVRNDAGTLKPGMFASALVRPKVSATGALPSDELVGRWVSPMHPTVVKDGPGTCDICGMDLVPAESLGIVGDSTVPAPMVVPRTAVLFTGVRSLVYVEVPNTDRPTYEGRDIVLGPRAGDLYTVRSGLQEGERVVVHGAFRVDSAMQLAPKPSMMSPTRARQQEHHSARADAVADAPDEFMEALPALLSAYIAAQEALADDDLHAFGRAAEQLQTAVDAMPQMGLLGASLAAWRRAASALRLETPATDIATARALFQRWSSGAIQLVRSFGNPSDATLTIAYCPMAFDDEGAEWLQRKEQIDNPYFGASMLLCGEFRDKFAPRATPNTNPQSPSQSTSRATTPPSSQPTSDPDADNHSGHSDPSDPSDPAGNNDGGRR